MVFEKQCGEPPPPSPRPLLMGDRRFQTTKNNAREIVQKKKHLLSYLYQISEGKEKITIFLLFPQKVKEIHGKFN